MSEFTMDQRRARGETIIDKHGVELVHGRVLTREALADYQDLVQEHHRVYFEMSPYRSDYAETIAAIEQDLLNKADDLAECVKKWFEDDEWEATAREYAVCRVAEES